MSNTMPRLITHAGAFHADEVFATAVLLMAHGLQPGQTDVLRVTELPEPEPGDIVYDIGFGEFDHHQPGRNGARPNGLPYAACGLVWKKYGPKVCSCPEAVRSVDAALIQGIDAIDNGVRPSRSKTVTGNQWAPMDVTAIIQAFNPIWDDPNVDDPEYRDTCFLYAVNMAYGILHRAIQTAEAFERAEFSVLAAIEKAKDGIMVLEKYCPWTSRLLRSDHPDAEDILYVIYPSLRGGWHWEAVPTRPDRTARRSLPPKEWHGASQEDLVRLTGVKDATFCHADGFIGACASKKGAIQVAKRAIELDRARRKGR